ncbi:MULTISPECIES: NtaA/DmoA family FMN-dependent monooxygenase [Brevibacillus]|jgi:FMN-dependent oxidoreductase, nitrilotriacetate monooxygenase family|uniref:Luciferase-like domain-containing protein n=1 Tax=Brevibacillus parabrevis TaxID=54914 RepID=A0A4Y3PDG7_BREPA|nr:MULTISPECIES: NtaA/DmoA family FMN-dependent monooxygenase [Brevibacillus]MBU8712825.1 NtaA/DmoA family FMN-dependent monooxygenase [Brevibacillus parabrevis]MDH6348333.1 FMN-dependent oxidoreductase (nitrilotriacetate monooxygenase family) [Brevibacillus sp. 1238]MDR5000473.1 NtaA/DmoA family FMN-dependent monooxygenase [Brevibacillus parabrevis]MED2256569.1 NtaA/DmoA family FMN-dependent monooxygenase [Brevibacillus parabrevis]NRQ52848.1 NtaA/DmoA family FMN-dependent monooxygenase [Brevi
MAENRQLCIGLAINTTWMKGAGWRRPDSDIEKLDTIDYYIDLAKMAEQAKLDFLFKADYLYVGPQMLGDAVSFGSVDPTLMFSAIARETERIGLVTTISTTFNPPFIVARQLQSLHWLSNGRAGWNIVTSIEGAENFGDAPMPSPQERYAKAKEFIEVVRKLWDSYPREAIVMDRETGIFTDRDKVTPINHSGEFFSVKGPLTMPAHASGSIPFFQAGASDTGRDFASSVADAIFAAMPDIESGVELRSDLRKRAEEHGRNPDAVKVLPGLYFFLGETREEAEELHKVAHANLSTERRLASLKFVLGMEASHLALDQRITADMLPDPNLPVRSRTHAELLRRFITKYEPTLQEVLARPEVVGSAHWVSVGTVDDVLADIIERYEAGAIDGFIALPGGSEKSMNIFFEQLMPKLVEKGLFKREYAGATLREHLGIQ